MRLRRAGVDAPGLRLARLPAVDGLFGDARGVVPGAGPQAAENDQQNDQDQRPAAPARNGMMVWVMRAVKPPNAAFQRLRSFPVVRRRCPGGCGRCSTAC